MIESIDTKLRQLLSPALAKEYNIIPANSNDLEIAFYIDEENLQDDIEQELELIFSKKINLIPLPSEEILEALNKYYYSEPTKSEYKAIKPGGVKEDLLHQLIREAKDVNASDIHLEALETEGRIRFRLDGKLVERYLIDKLEYLALINKVKIFAHLDIAEKRLPQDGRINFKDDNQHKTDLRISVLPTMYGEKVVIRLLGGNEDNWKLESLGFNELELKTYSKNLNKHQGIILISGPTGSGKTTTLYATLKFLNNEHTNILTIEDPVEYTLRGINQVALKEQIGLDFSVALKTFLRQDPDVIMVGEIRNKETAELAIRAALTGHLVLSTIHTNSAWGTITRLADMGVPPYLLASTLNISIAQRLVRLLCPSCKIKLKDVSPEMREHFSSEELKNHIIYEANGCNECYSTGYKGRRAIYEIIPVDSDIALKIRIHEIDISPLLEEKKFVSLKNNAKNLIISGQTSFEEAYPLLLTF